MLQNRSSSLQASGESAGRNVMQIASLNYAQSCVAWAAEEKRNANYE
jgi:hypothetical protein